MASPERREGFRLGHELLVAGDEMGKALAKLVSRCYEDLDEELLLDALSAMRGWGDVKARLREWT